MAKKERIVGVESMREYWHDDNILVDDAELLVLRGLGGPDEYLYFVRLRTAKNDMEFRYRTTDGSMVSDFAAKDFEEDLIAGLRKMNEQMRNMDDSDREWKNRKKR